MRQKKNYMILTFKTTTAAMAMEKKCGEDKIPGRADSSAGRNQCRMRTVLADFAGGI